MNADFLKNLFCEHLCKLRAFFSNPQIRQHFADAVDDLGQARMRLFNVLDGRAQSLQREFAQLRILLGARGLVRGKLRKTGDAVGLFALRFGKAGHFRFQRAEQLEQFLFAFGADIFRAADLGLNFADGVFNHGGQLTLRLKSGKQIHQRPSEGNTGRTSSQTRPQTPSTEPEASNCRTRLGSAAAMAAKPFSTRSKNFRSASSIRSRMNGRFDWRMARRNSLISDETVSSNVKSGRVAPTAMSMTDCTIAKSSSRP